MGNSENIFFEIENNFKQTENTHSICIIRANNEDSLFTIAIPTYKRANLLKEAINSALNQETFVNYTILVVDNNPERNDETETLLLSYKDDGHTNISYYKNSVNIGMTGNWNRLYTLSKSKYVVMLHDDDLLYPDYLKNISEIISETKASYSGYFPAYSTYDVKQMDEPLQQKNAKKSISNLKTSHFLFGNIIGPPVGMCLDRKAVTTMGGFSTSNYPSIDYDFYVKLSYHYPICRIEGYPLSIYRISENESCKTETLLAFIRCDLEIKRAIIKEKNILKRKIWEAYIKVYSYEYLSRMKRVFHNEDLNCNQELIRMNITYKRNEFYIYKIINYYKRALAYFYHF